MKHFIYTILMTVFIFNSFLSSAQKQDVIISEDPGFETGLYEKDIKPEGIEILAAFNEGGDVTIDFKTDSQKEFLSLKIFDVTGKLVLSKDFLATNVHNRIRVGSSISSKGVYIITLSSKNNKTVRKFYL